MNKNVFKQIARFTGPVVLGLAIIVGTIFALLALPATETLAQEPGMISTQAVTKTAYVVIRYGDKDVDVRLIHFTGTISGWGALELAGLNPSGSGGGLAKINGYGNPDNDPFGNTSTRYWATYHVENGAWAFNSRGVTDSGISENGHVEGFSWSDPGWVGVEPPAEARMKSAAAALNWLRKQQDADGGYGGIGGATEALMAVAANGCDPDEWNVEGGESLLDYIQANGGTYTSKASTTGKLMVSLAAAGEDVTTFLGGSLVATMTGYYSPTTGAYDSGTAYDQGAGPHSWAILGMRAAGETVPVTATQYLTGNMQVEGCWEWSSGWGCDTNSTSLAIQALIVTGVPTTATEVSSAVTWLKARQNKDGGFPYGSGDSDANSTAYVIQALLATGELLSGLANGNPIDYLRDMQQSNGQVYWQDDNAGSGTITTRQVIPPLLDTPFPISRAAGLTACPLTEMLNSYYLPLILRN